MMEYFFVIDLEGLEGKAYGKGLSHAFYTLHGALHREGLGQVGVSFPEWRSAPSRADVCLGDYFLVISDNLEALENVVAVYNSLILHNTHPSLLSIMAGDIGVVPEHSERVVFRRNRRRQKYFRQINDPANGNEVINDALEQLDKLPICPRIFMSSKGTKQNFCFEISKEKAENTEIQGKFSSYGLASGEHLRSVPLFKISED